MSKEYGGWTPIYSRKERFIRWLLRKPNREYIITYQETGIDGRYITVGERMVLKQEPTKKSKGEL